MKIVLKSRVLLIGLLVLFLTACGGSGEDTPISDLEAPDNTQEVRDYYASKPEFFTFAVSRITEIRMRSALNR